MLSQAERKIEVLAGFDAEGNPITEPLLEDDGESLEEKADQRSRRRSHSPPGNGPRRIPDDEIPF
jgi:hypothetical protein